MLSTRQTLGGCGAAGVFGVEPRHSARSVRAQGIGWSAASTKFDSGSAPRRASDFQQVSRLDAGEAEMCRHDDGGGGRSSAGTEVAAASAKCFFFDSSNYAAAGRDFDTPVLDWLRQIRFARAHHCCCLWFVG